MASTLEKDEKEGYPDPEDICDLADELAEEFRGQHDEDIEVRDVLLREHAIEVQKPDEGHTIKKITSGYPALIVEQDFSFLTTPPFLKINPLSASQEPHAEKLETGLLGMWMLSQGQRDVWLDQVYDFVWAGRGWSMITPVPELWSGTKYERPDGEETKPYLDRIASYKEEEFPIIWKSVPVEDTWPTFDLRGDIDEVVGIREMKVRDVRRHYGTSLLSKRENKDVVKVIEYANSQWFCTVLRDEGKDAEVPEIVHAWNHALGCNPFVLIEAPRSAPRGGKQQWQGALYHTRELLVELDSLISDIRYNIKRATRGQLVAQLDLEGRGTSPDERGNPDTLTIKPTEAVVIDKEEKLYELEPARTNIDAYRLVEIIQGLTKEVAVRSVLLGILGQGGKESGILYNTAAQFAQKQYGPAVTQLQKGAVGAGVRLFRSVEAFADEDEEIPILFTTAYGKTERIGLKAKDVKGWSRSIQARIELAIPVNEASEITNARLVTDPNNPLMSYESAAQRYLRIENPLEEWKKMTRTAIRRAIVPLVTQLVTESGLHLMSSAGADDPELAGQFSDLPEGIQQAITMLSAQTGQPVPSQAAQGQLGRSNSNTAKGARFQNTKAVSQTSSQQPSEPGGY